MKRAGVLSVCVALAALAAAPGAGVARARLAHCPDFKTHGLAVTKVRSNFGCSRAKTVLRNLLKKGTKGLPAKTRHKGRWGCGRSHADRVCTRFRARKKRDRLLFRAATAIGTNGSSEAVNQCIDIWNADGSNRATYGFHFYNDHGIRGAWVFTIPNTIFPSILRCAVIFAIPPHDPYRYEYGTDGEVRTSTGKEWQLMNKVPELGDPNAVQAQATQNVNATLLADASLQRK